jgi:lipoprotein
MGMLNMRKPILSLVGLLAVVSLVGCQQAEGKKENSKELSQEQIIDKGLQAFEHLKDGEIKLENKIEREFSEPTSDGSTHTVYTPTFEGSFELKPVRVRGLYTNNGTSQEEYYDAFHEYSRPKDSSEWEMFSYSQENKQPVGVNQEAIRFFQTQKDKFEVTKKKDQYVLTYKSKDVNHLLEPNNAVLQGPVPIGVSYFENSEGSYQIDLIVSKENLTPLGVTYTCTSNSSFAKEKLTCKITYSKQNTGVQVEVPEAVEKLGGI